MNDSSFYINEIKRIQGIESDYAVAKLLNVSRQMMTKYHNGRSSFDSNLVFKVAELSGHNPLEIIANIRASREKDPAFMKKWAELARMVSRTAAVVILSVVLFGAPALLTYQSIISSTLYIMLSSIILIYATRHYAAHRFKSINYTPPSDILSTFDKQ